MAYSFGEWTQLHHFFLLVIAVDYVTGVAASLKEGKGLSSAFGFWGIAKKGLMLLIVMIAHRMDLLLGTNLVMIGTIYFYTANELVSITENYGRMGLPLPDVIRRMITVLKNKGDSGRN